MRTELWLFLFSTFIFTVNCDLSFFLMLHSFLFLSFHFSLPVSVYVGSYLLLYLKPIIKTKTNFFYQLVSTDLFFQEMQIGLCIPQKDSKTWNHLHPWGK